MHLHTLSMIKKTSFRSTARITLFLLLSILFTSCGGGDGSTSPIPSTSSDGMPPLLVGTPPSISATMPATQNSCSAPLPIIVSGAVQVPSGQIAFSRSQDLIERIVELIVPEANALISGLSSVPDGTTVELDRIDDNGAIISTVATTTTSGGNYAFDISKSNLSLSSDLIVRVSNVSTGTQMRAFAGIGITNINPTSEAAVRVVLGMTAPNNGIRLSNFSPQEQNDITASIDLLTTVNKLSPGIDLETSISAIMSAVAVDTNVMGYITSASADGQTSIGPGDIGNYSPTSIGNMWTYRTTVTPGSSANIKKTNSFTGTKMFNGRLTSVSSEIKSDQFGTSSKEDYVVKNSNGYFQYGDNDPKDIMLPQIAPVERLEFPIQPGRTFGKINKTGLNYGQDLDGDGIPETFDLSEANTYVGFETITVPAGMFSNAVKLTKSSAAKISLSTTKKQVLVIATENLWLAPGIGIVRIDQIVQHISSENVPFTETNAYELTGAIVDNKGQGLRIQISQSFNLGGINNIPTPAVVLHATQQFTAQAFDQANNPFTDLTFSWNTSHSEVATIDGNGLATGLSLGSSTITASAGGIVSNPIPLYVFDIKFQTCTMQLCDIVYDPLRKKIYTTSTENDFVGNIDIPKNSIKTINPLTGTIESSIPISNTGKIGKLALSDDGQFLYVALNGSSTLSPFIQRINLTTSSVDLQFGVTGSPPSISVFHIFDMKVLPGAPHSVAVATGSYTCSPCFGGLIIYDDGVPRLNTIQGSSVSAYEIDRIEFSSSSSVLYGTNLGGQSDFYRISINSTGASLIDVTKNLIRDNADPTYSFSIKFIGGLIYASSGQVIDPSASIPKIIGKFSIPGEEPVIVLDPAIGKAYSFSIDTLVGPYLTDFSVFSINSYQLFDSMIIESGGAGLGVDISRGGNIEFEFIKIDSNIFAFISYDKIVLFSSPF